MKYRFLIYISYSYAVPIGKPLQKEILKRGDDVKWFSEFEKPKSLLNHSELLSTVEEAINYNPHIVLTIADSVADFIPGIKVQIFHGFLANKHSLKKGHFRIRGFFDLYCTQGPSTTNYFKFLQEKHRTFEVIETGWSKVDPLFPISKTENKKPVILISSTFSAKYSLSYNDKVIAEIERLSKLGKWEFLVILHPKMELGNIQKFENIQNENLKYIPTTDIIPLFKQADVMFADTTSAITEFILQNKPVVTFKNNKPGPYLINITKPEEIEDAIAKALSHPAKIMDSIEEYVLETHPYFDGNSSKRVIDACIDFLHADKSYLKPKPLNIIRKYKVRKLLNYYTLKTYRKLYTIPENHKN